MPWVLAAMPFWPGHLDHLDLAGLRVDAAERGVVVGHVGGEPDIAVEVGPRIMHQRADARGRSLRPVAAVVDRILGRHVGVGLHRDVVFLVHDARRLAGRTRPQLELHRGLARPARARQIGGQLLLIEVEHAVELVRAEIDPGDVDVLHQVDDRAPAGGVELVLQRIVRGVAAGAVVVHEALQARVVRRLVGQRGDHQIAGQLPLEIRERGELEVLMLGGAEIDLALGGREGEGLRPDPVLAGRQRREIIVAAFVGEDRGGDGGAFRLGGDRDAGELLARRRGDRSAQQRIGGLRRQRDEGRRRQSGRRDGGQGQTLCMSGRVWMSHVISPCRGADPLSAPPARADSGAGTVFR